MRYINQLEPDALVARFDEHPPIDFRAGDIAGAPAFSTRFDLLTTAEEALRERVVRMRGYRRWGHLLRWYTVFIGTTVSEYALFPQDSDPSSLPQQLREQSSSCARLVIVKDVPIASPLLDDVTNGWNRRFLAACDKEGFVLLEGQALAYVPIDFADEDAYISRLSSSRRKDIRRKLRKRNELHMETVHCGDPLFADEATIDAFYALYENVYAQSDIHFDKLSRTFFAAVFRDASQGGVVFVYRHQDTMIGWNLCFVVGDKLVDKYIGFAYPQARNVNLYFVSWFCNLAYAKAQGLTHYVAGWTDHDVKASLGARFTVTRHAIYLRNPLLRFLARRMGRLFDGEGRQVSADEQA